MNKIKLQIKSIAGSILFEYEKEDNTILQTLIAAIKEGANLYGAYLYGANLYGANLEGANLEGANLKGANLEGANLKGANLEGAYLKGANLYGANLYGAYLEGANLYGAYLYGANLEGANLFGANLEGANLYGAYLYGANLYGAKDIPYIPLNCPSEGSFIGWKKVCGNLIKLEIPEDAKRLSSVSMKCRCDKAKVLSVWNMRLKEEVSEVVNHAYNQNTLYKVGEMVYPDYFDEDRWNECSHGIHFFINKQDAINYL